MTGLHKFLICLLAVVVAVSLGVTVYYFARPSNEVLTLSSTALSENIGDEFTITINQENANKRTELKLVSDKEDIVQFVEKDAKGLTYKFKAKAAGHANIKLVTSNEDYSGANTLLCGVDVADGSSNNPYYIRNADDLLNITATGGYGIDKHYRQIANVDLNGKTFSPIGSTEANAFTGSYNGNEYTISNMTISSNDVYAGMFGVVDSYAIVSNVKLSNAMINGASKYVGSIAGLNKGKILDCEVTESSLATTAAASYAGGIAGVNTNNIFTSSYNGEIASAEYIGGVVALNNGPARIQDCYARGEFSPVANSKMGGVVANNFAVSNNRANIVNCYSTVKNKDTTNGNMGMIVYSNLNNDSTVTLTNENSIANRVYGNHYATTQGYTGIYSTPDVAAFVSPIANKTSTQSYSTFAANGIASTWNFTNIWSLSSTLNDGYPTLRSNANVYANSESVYIPGVEDSEDPTPQPIVVDSSIITTAAQLNALSRQETLDAVEYLWTKDYSLGADIDLGNEDWSSMANFVGSLDGKGHTISNFKIVAGTGYYVGFANTLTGTIKNVKFNNVTVNASGSHEFGVVAGENKGYVYNVEVNGLTVTNSAPFGGIVATNINLVKTVKVTAMTATINSDFGGIAFNNSDSAVIENAKVVASNNVAVNANATNLGGIVAINCGTVLNADTNVSYNNNSNKAGRMGGIAGLNKGKLESVTYNGNSLAYTTTSNDATVLGGIAGNNEGSILNAVVSVDSIALTGSENAKVGAIAGSSSGDITHALATVNTINSSAYAGGLTGEVSGGTISASGINTAKVSAKYVGGLAGTMNSGTIADSYTKVTLNGSEDSCGMACAIKSGARVENCYIAPKFDNDASGRKFETQTKIRQNQGGSVSNNVINKDVMGGCGKGDSKRQYSNWYIPIGLPGNVWFEINTPDDNLYDEEDCKSISTYTDKNWSTTIWTFVDGQEPTIA